MPLPSPLRGFRAAIVFLTRFPIGGFPYVDGDFQWASAYFPLVGALLGTLMGAVFLLCARAGSLVAAAVVVALSMLWTGAFHEDGLADTADAMGGAYDRDKLFLILKDSRVGSFGAGALAIVLLLRVLLLARLGAFAPWALVITQCLARTGPVWMMVAMPYVTSDAASKSRQVTRARPIQGLVATLWPTLLLSALLGNGVLHVVDLGAMLGMLTVSTLYCAYRFWVRAGGITGDFLGATEQVGECVALLGLAITRGGPL